MISLWSWLAGDDGLTAKRYFPDAPESNCRSEPARDGGLIANEYSPDAPGSNCGSWLASDGGMTGYEVLRVYISIPEVRAAMGFAFTASHFRRAGMPAQSKVTKALLPHHLAPRLGSVCPHSGMLRGPPRWAIPGPARLNRHPCRFTRCSIPAFGQRGLTGRLRSKSKAKRGGLTADLTLEVCAFPCGSRACSRLMLTMTQCHCENAAMV